MRRVLAYLVKAKIVLDGVRWVEDGPIGSDDKDKAVESLRDDQKMQKRLKYLVQQEQERHTYSPHIYAHIYVSVIRMSYWS